MSFGIHQAFGRVWGVVALSLVVLALTACGASSEPTAAPATAAGPTDASASSQSATTEAPAPSAMMAPTFELPNAAGETVTLASYAGDRNVVLVFYRGFW